MYATERITCLPRSQRGASLITAVFLITALAVLAALTTKLTQFTNTKTLKEWYAVQALASAESAVSAAAYDIINANNCAARTGVTVTVASGSASYDASCSQPGLGGNTVNLYQIAATGSAGSGDHQATRRIVVQLAP